MIGLKGLKVHKEKRWFSEFFEFLKFIEFFGFFMLFNFFVFFSFFEFSEFFEANRFFWGRDRYAEVIMSSVRLETHPSIPSIYAGF